MKPLVTRLRKEALALAKLDHPNVATIPEFGSQSGVVRNRCSGPIAALPHRENDPPQFLVQTGTSLILGSS